MINKFYYKLGLFLGIVGTAIGIIGFVMRFFVASDHSAVTFINYSLCLCWGVLVIYETLCSKKDPRKRYLAKQFQTALLFTAGVLVLVNSGDIAGVICLLLSLTLAYRYSFLKPPVFIMTAVLSCVLLLIYAFMHDLGLADIIHELLFTAFSFITFFVIYANFNQLLSKRLKRLYVELDMARQIIPFGTELRKKIDSSDVGEVDFTRKEYEVMVALCFYDKHSNEELSDFMNISIATVKSHLNNIYRKTDIHSRSRLITVYKDIFVERRNAEQINISAAEPTDS